MLSNNLLKSNWSIVDEDVRVINNTELIENRVRESIKRDSQIREDVDYGDPYGDGSPEGGFQSGLQAEMLEGYEGEEGEGAPVIKAAPPEPAYAGPSPEELLQEAQEEIDRMRAQLEEEAAATKQQAADEGFAQGRQEGYNQGLQEGHDEGFQRGYDEGMSSAEEHIAEQKLLLEKEYNKRSEALEPMLVDKITSIYEHVFHINLESLRDVVVGLLTACLQRVESSRNYIIHTSKEDYPYVSMQKRHLQEAIGAREANLEVIEDTMLSKNQCMVETDMGIYDCSLDMELIALKKELQLLSYSE